jgi:hypothetical protein
VNREHLEHLIASIATLTGDDEVVIIGSQAMLASYPEAPDELRESVEADFYPLKPSR